MSRTINASTVSAHRISLEDVRPDMAKVGLNKLEDRDFRSEIGRAVQRAISLANLSQKEVAALLQRDTAQIARWVAGTERPQFDALFSVEALREPLVVALAQLSGAVVELDIKFRRTA